MSEQIKDFKFRDNTRAPFETMVRLRFDRFGGTVSAFSADISMEGMFVRTDDPKPVGTLVQFEFNLGENDDLIQGLGDVVWVRSDDTVSGKPKGMGIQFRYIDPQSRDLIYRIVSGYLEEKKAEAEQHAGEASLAASSAPTPRAPEPSLPAAPSDGPASPPQSAPPVAETQAPGSAPPSEPSPGPPPRQREDSGPIILRAPTEVVPPGDFVPAFGAKAEELGSGSEPPRIPASPDARPPAERPRVEAPIINEPSLDQTVVSGAANKGSALGQFAAEEPTPPGSELEQLVGEDAANVGGDAANVGGDAANVGEDAANVGGDAANVGEDAANVGEDAAIVGEGVHELDLDDAVLEPLAPDETSELFAAEAVAGPPPELAALDPRAGAAANETTASTTQAPFELESQSLSGEVASDSAGPAKEVGAEVAGAPIAEPAAPEDLDRTLVVDPDLMATRVLETPAPEESTGVNQLSDSELAAVLGTPAQAPASDPTPSVNPFKPPPVANADLPDYLQPGPSRSLPGWLLPAALALVALLAAGYFFRQSLMGWYGDITGTSTRVADTTVVDATRVGPVNGDSTGPDSANVDPGDRAPTATSDATESESSTGSGVPDQSTPVGSELGVDDEFESASADPGNLEPPDVAEGPSADTANDSSAVTPPVGDAAAAAPQPEIASDAGGASASDGAGQLPSRLASVVARQVGGATLVVLRADRPISSGSYSYLQLSGPPRFVVKLEGIREPFQGQASSTHIRGLRSGLHGGAASPEIHLVFDLASESIDATLEAQADGSLEIRLEDG